MTYILRRRRAIISQLVNVYIIPLSGAVGSTDEKLGGSGVSYYNEEYECVIESPALMSYICRRGTPRDLLLGPA